MTNTPASTTVAVRESTPTHHLAGMELVTARVGRQLCGLPVLLVQDVLGPQTIARIPLSPHEVAGSLNLRGRIVTVIDLRTRLGLPPRDDGGDSMSVVIDHHGELYSLLVDSIGEVLDLPTDALEPNPVNLSPTWREFSQGIHRQNGELVVVLDMAKLLDFTAP